MSEENKSDICEHEKACWDSIVSSKRLFQCNEGKGCPEFYETLKLKLNTKINHEYGNVSKVDDLATQIHSDLKEI